MEDKKYSITLSNGTKLEDLRLNGNNFISAAPVTKDMFEGNLSEVTVNDGETETTYKDLDLVQITEDGGEYWFVLRSLTPDELFRIKMQSDIEYIAMMADVEL